MDNQICGVHAVYEALKAGNPPIERIHVGRETRSPKLQDVLELARQRSVPVRREDRTVLERMAPDTSHQGIIAICGEFRYQPIDVLFAKPNPCVVVLDGVEDPHNLGAVIRTAEASHASGIVVPERHAAPLSATVAKASAGALAHVPVVRVGNLVSFLEQSKKKGVWVVGVDASGEKLWTDFDYTVPVALVFGGEHRGLRRLVREHCDAVVRLPMLGKVESLNVSVTAGVVLYEVIRQRALLSSKS
ncbi:MAG TPA: 23S rRNA (guanosine(2251)-2'-O)-methyltransferase RlmB [Terriglobia bacterium]|nr:23S rRNA (guanosine(2251)-2'-O)-methyltransferase RlmB [Terriglobia bacterium]